MALTIVNFGLDTLIISGMQVIGAPFHLEPSQVFPLRLGYEEEATATIIFNLTTAGEAVGTLNILSNDPAMPIKSVHLQGRSFVIHPAKEGVIYAVTGRESKGALLTVESSTGAGTKTGLTGFEELTGMTIRPSNGELLATSIRANSTWLVRIDTESGISRILSVLPVPYMRAIAFDSNDELYGITLIGGNLYLIDPIMGKATLLGSTGLGAFVGLAINPLDGNLWGMRVNGAIYKINKSTAAPTLVGNTGFRQNLAMVFDAAGKLFGTSGFALGTVSDLISIDTSTGAGTLIGSTGFKDVFGLAVRGSVITGVDNRISELLPTRYELHQNFPNPFNPSTKIEFALPRQSYVTLKVYNLFGEEVVTLVEKNLAPGFYDINWETGELSSGVYFYRLQASDPATGFPNKSGRAGHGFTETKKLILVK
jgi:hypothetical protein